MLQNLEKENEARLSELNLKYNDKMEKLVKQLQKMKKRQDNSMQEKE